MCSIAIVLITNASNAKTGIFACCRCHEEGLKGDWRQIERGAWGRGAAELLFQHIVHVMPFEQTGEGVPGGHVRHFPDRIFDLFFKPKLLQRIGNAMGQRFVVDVGLGQIVGGTGLDHARGHQLVTVARDGDNRDIHLFSRQPIQQIEPLAVG